MVKMDEMLLTKKPHGLLHQIWFGIIPNKKSAAKMWTSQQSFRESWAVNNPNWHIHTWSLQECQWLQRTKFPEYSETISKYKWPIQFCDLVRCMILSRYGGWYADCDYTCHRPFRTCRRMIKSNHVWIAQTPNAVLGSQTLSNALMYSDRSQEAKDFWTRLLEACSIAVDQVSGLKHIIVMYTTGPAIVTRIGIENNIGILPSRLFFPAGLGDENHRLGHIHEDGIAPYASHIGRGAWQGSDSIWLTCIYANWRYIVTCILIALGIFLIVKSQLFKMIKTAGRLSGHKTMGLTVQPQQQDIEMILMGSSVHSQVGQSNEDSSAQLPPSASPTLQPLRYQK
jgi:Glycosyltransferase sugar-binding region containing DXD motif